MCEQVDWFVDARTIHAYRVFHDAKSWQEAGQSCEKLGTHLATLFTGSIAYGTTGSANFRTATCVKWTEDRRGHGRRGPDRTRWTTS